MNNTRSIITLAELLKMSSEEYNAWFEEQERLCEESNSEYEDRALKKFIKEPKKE